MRLAGCANAKPRFRGLLKITCEYEGIATSCRRQGQTTRMKQEVDRHAPNLSSRVFELPHPEVPEISPLRSHCPRQPDRTTLRYAPSPSLRYGTLYVRSSAQSQSASLSRGTFPLRQ